MTETDLVGKRVRHKCDDPTCPLKGSVLKVVYWPQQTLGGESSDYWAIVQWDAFEGKVSSIPSGYIQAVPIYKVEVIHERG